ncbi:MAG: hypothetical protein E1N59_1722 [Puniceicoccaceae bacterium 5H]|nr:MAG: hypothetical protein E1N59_1722 [Puniceicoccaceae bacterium 5H]
MEFVFVMLLQCVVAGFFAYGVAQFLFRQSTARQLCRARQIVMLLGLICLLLYMLIFIDIVWRDRPNLFSLLPPMFLGAETIAIWIGLLAASRGRE